jgi:LacI family transcriptional regulator
LFVLGGRNGLLTGERTITIKDVARVAGVGISTVSRALNASGSVSPTTRDRILKVASDLGYRPSIIAQSLVTHSTGTLGLVIPDLRNPYFPALARGVEDTAIRHGFTVMLGNTDNDPSRELTYVRTLVDKQVDGIILFGTATDAVLARRIVAAGIPLVSPDPGLADLADIVRIDQVASARRATEHLISLGHRRIAHLAAPSWTRTGRERLQGYREALSAAGLPIASAYVSVGDWQTTGGAQAVREIWAEAAQPPTAIYAGNDLMAIGAAEALRERGIRVPEDVALLGHGNVPFGSMVTPALSSMGEPHYQWGETAFSLILDRIRGQCTEPYRMITLPFHLVIRQSCGAAARGV